MKSEKKLGIWMDHSSANLMEFTDGEVEETVIDSEFTHEEKAHSQMKSEHIMHNKEQQQQGAFYKKLGESIKNYDRVLLFGPTDAKLELFNTLKEDAHFTKIKIEVQQADKMTENQQHAFVKHYFSK
jgi:hypothetical protein